MLTSINVFVILVISFFLGKYVLAFFGISLSALKIAGGLVIASSGFALLKGEFSKNRGMKMDLKEKAMNALITKGFTEDKVIMALPTKVGNVGDYMAMLWMPPNPDHIKIQQITKVDEVEPEGMVGLWKGVSKDDIDTVQL